MTILRHLKKNLESFYLITSSEEQKGFEDAQLIEQWDVDTIEKAAQVLQKLKQSEQQS